MKERGECANRRTRWRISVPHSVPHYCGHFNNTTGLRNGASIIIIQLYAQR
jgi:hypothetical protein